MVVDLSVPIIQVSVSVAIMHSEVSTALMQVTFYEENMWITIFIVKRQLRVSVGVYAGGIFCSALCT